MTHDKLNTILTTLLVAGSCLVIWPFEAALYVVLLLGVLYLLQGSRRSKYLIFLACLVAVACVDAWIHNVWLSGLLMIGRHIGTAVLLILILLSMRKQRESENLQPPIKRRRLIVAVSVLPLVPALVFVLIVSTRHMALPSWLALLFLLILLVTLPILAYLVVKTLACSWGRSVFLYIPGLLIAGCLFIQLLWDSLYLAAVHDIYSCAASRGKIPATSHNDLPEYPSTFQTPTMTALYDETTNPDGAIRAAAVRGLGHRLEMEAIHSWPDELNFRDWPNERYWQHPYWQGEHSNQIAEIILPQFIEFLSDDDPRVRIAAFVKLEEIGPWGIPAIPALRNILQEHGEVSRNQRSAQGSTSEAFTTMERFQQGSGKGLEDLEPGLIRMSVPLSFFSIGPGARDAVPDLIPLLEDVLWPVQQNAAMALERIGPDAKDAIPALEAAASLKSNDDRVRSKAALALWSLEHNPPLVPQILLEILSDGTPEGQSSAADAVYRIGPPAADWAIPALIPLTTHQNTEVKSSATSALCEVGIESAESVEAVLKAIQSEPKTNNEFHWSIDADFKRLQANARGPAADALKQGMEKINNTSSIESN